MTKKKPTLEEAKANFKEALMEFDPAVMIRRRPMRAAGMVAAAGLIMAVAGRRTMRAFVPGAKLMADILKKVV